MVLIVHSQGGIIGSLVIDWLLDEVPRDVLHKLEVYSFASAANHFNNPYRHLQAAQAAGVHRKPGPESKAIRYIEHYANSQDFVSRWGVLTFARIHNRYMGKAAVQIKISGLLILVFNQDAFLSGLAVVTC